MLRSAHHAIPSVANYIQLEHLYILHIQVLWDHASLESARANIRLHPESLLVCSQVLAPQCRDRSCFHSVCFLAVSFLHRTP